MFPCRTHLLLRGFLIAHTKSAFAGRGQVGLVALRAPTALGRTQWSPRETARCMLLLVGALLADHYGSFALDQFREAAAVHSLLPGYRDRRLLRSHRQYARHIPHTLRHRGPLPAGLFRIKGHQSNALYATVHYR